MQAPITTRNRSRGRLKPWEEWTRIAYHLRAISESEDWQQRDARSSTGAEPLAPGATARTRIDFYLDRLLAWQRRNPDNRIHLEPHQVAGPRTAAGFHAERAGPGRPLDAAGSTART
jgi:hypothetical protein